MPNAIPSCQALVEACDLVQSACGESNLEHAVAALKALEDAYRDLLQRRVPPGRYGKAKGYNPRPMTRPAERCSLVHGLGELPGKTPTLYTRRGGELGRGFAVPPPAPASPRSGQIPYALVARTKTEQENAFHAQALWAKRLVAARAGVARLKHKNMRESAKAASSPHSERSPRVMTRLHAGHEWWQELPGSAREEWQTPPMYVAPPQHREKRAVPASVRQGRAGGSDPHVSVQTRHVEPIAPLKPPRWHASMVAPPLQAVSTHTTAPMLESDVDGDDPCKPSRGLHGTLQDASHTAGIELLDAVLAGDVEGCKDLLRAGASVCERIDGQTPILMAAQLGLNDICVTLLMARANPNDENELGQTPLMLAQQEGFRDLAALLVARGGNVSSCPQDVTLHPAQLSPIDEPADCSQRERPLSAPCGRPSGNRGENVDRAFCTSSSTSDALMQFAQEASVDVGSRVLPGDGLASADISPSHCAPTIWPDSANSPRIRQGSAPMTGVGKM